MKSFARVTKLSNVGGRADYISDPKRQENIVATSPPIDWKPYQDYERANRKSTEKNNEGREVMLTLPNEWKDLTPDELTSRAHTVAVTAIGKETDMQWAVHLNSAGTIDPKGRKREVDNLHLHVVFSERRKTDEISYYDRDVYHTGDGKVARRKADRAKVKDGNDKPPVHRKGDAKGGFTPKDPNYKDYEWKDQMKIRVKAEMERMGATIEPPDLIHQRHEGKGSEAPQIRIKNQFIKAANNNLKTIEAEGGNLRNAIALVLKHFKQGKFPVIGKQNGAWVVAGFNTVKEAIDSVRRGGKAPARPAPISEPPSAPPRPEMHPATPDFTALIDAQREYFRQTYALYAPKPRTSAAAVKHSKTSQAYDALDTAHRNFEAARFKRSQLGIGKKKEKAALDDSISRYRADGDSAFNTLRNLGVSVYSGGAEMSWSYREHFEEIKRRAEMKIADLKREANHDARFYRTDTDIPKASPVAQKAAQERFNALLRKIDPDSREAARSALEAALGDFSGNSVAAQMKAISAIQNAIKNEMPPPQIQKRAREHDR